MGLPIWRDPEENISKRDAVKNDPTAAARSSIRRRPSLHGRRATRPRLPRESSRRPGERPPPPAFASSRPREWRRSEYRNLPSVATLLESADPRPVAPPAPLPPAPVPHNADLQDADTSQHWDDFERQIWLDQRDVARTRSPYPTTSRAVVHQQSGLSDATLRSRLNAPPEPSSNRRPSPDVSEEAQRLLFDQAERVRYMRRGTHPLRRSWRPESPIDGLGDRIRSPTPADGWEIMRSTIAPDATLPSAESSFTSAVVSQSFSSGGTTITEPERFSSSDGSRRTSEEDGNQSDSVSSVDPDDLICNDEEREATASFAQDMYFHEWGYPEGNERVVRHRAAHAAEGNRYALSGEPEWVEIGFRLINEALDTPEGRARVFQLSQDRPAPGPEHRDFEQWIFAHRRDGGARTRLAHVTDDEPPSPHPERYGNDARTAVRQARAQVNDYFRRFTADAYAGSDSRSRDSGLHSPPPRYVRLEDTSASRDAPELQALSPPSSRSQRDVGDALLSGDEQDLDGVRHIVERLAQRDDIPDEWWTSVGLARHLTQSRGRLRSRSPDRRSPLSPNAVRRSTGRGERRSRSPRL